MINKNQIIRRADADEVPAATVERDYVLTHALCAIAAEQEAQGMVFKGGTALRVCFFTEYRYSADLDFSLIDGLTRAQATDAVRHALQVARAAIGLPTLELREDPELQRPAADRVPGPARQGAPDQAGPRRGRAGDRSPPDTTADPLPGPATQRSRPRVHPPGDHRGEAEMRVRPACPLHRPGHKPRGDLAGVEHKARHRDIDPASFRERFEHRTWAYRNQWDAEMQEHVLGPPPNFDALLRAVRRHLRAWLRD